MRRADQVDPVVLADAGDVALQPRSEPVPVGPSGAEVDLVLSQALRVPVDREGPSAGRRRADLADPVPVAVVGPRSASAQLYVGEGIVERPTDRFDVI